MHNYTHTVLQSKTHRNFLQKFGKFSAEERSVHKTVQNYEHTFLQNKTHGNFVQKLHRNL